MDIKAQPITTVDHPIDGIGEAGIREVRSMLFSEEILRWDCNFNDVLDDIGTEWIVKKGKYAGTFPKRLAKSIKARFSTKIDAEMLGKIGELAKRHTVKAQGYKLDFTSDFSWRAGAFGDEGSCFWGDHGGAKDMICDAGGLAVRFYDEEDRGYGRAWMLPYGKHWVIFNAYGKSLTTITVARILATEMGWGYKRIHFENNGSYDNELWINGGSAYIIGETGKIDGIDRVDLELEETGRGSYICDSCDEYIDDYYCVDGRYYCNHCYEDLFFYCERCGSDQSTDDMHEVHMTHRNSSLYSEWVCYDCYKDCALECVKCHRDIEQDGTVEVQDKTVCIDCLGDLGICEDCGEPYLTPHITTDYPRASNGQFDYKVETVRCYDCWMDSKQEAA